MTPFQNVYTVESAVQFRHNAREWSGDMPTYYYSDVSDDDDLLDEGMVPEDQCYTVEQDILDRVSIETMMARLAPDEQAIAELLYSYKTQQDYDGLWPPRAEDVAAYLSGRHGRLGRVGRMLGRVATRTVRERHRRVLAQWAEWRAADGWRDAA
jgi:hypothetical protein